MKLIVFSDSHTDVSSMLHAVKTRRPDVVLHLGDHAADAAALQQETPLKTYLVRGNTDQEGEEEALLTFMNTRIYMTHGLRYDVENGMTQLYEAAARIKPHIVLFGHTHKPYLSYTDGVWYMNPGRIGRKSSKTIHATYGVIRLSGNSIECGISEAE